MKHSYPRSHAPRSHNVTSGGGDKPPVPEPSYSERARTLLHLGSVGTLSTWSERQPGFPFGSVMPYALDDDGRPLFLISALAMHTQNLKKDPRSSLLVTEESVGKDPLGAGRVTLVGNSTAVPGDETGTVRETYLGRQPNARYWVDYRDFAFYRMDVVDVYFVGGFGVMDWVEAGDYTVANPDPLADAAAGILSHMNEDHPDSLVLLARHFGELPAEGATMTRLDRLGFHLRLEADGRVQGCRIPFLREARKPQEVRAVLVEMTRQARRAATES